MTEMTIEQAIESGRTHHQAGRLAEAEALYRQVLVRFPDHPEALHLLGVVAAQTRHAEAAIALIGRAIAVNPTAAEYQINLGNALKDLGRLDEAIDAYQRAIQLSPGSGSAAAHCNLGNALKQRGQLDAAIDAYQRAIQLHPGYAVAQSNLGNALADQGRLDEAIEAHRRAIQLCPGYAPAHSNLGNALRDRRMLDEAIDAYQRAIQLRPGYALAHSNLGSALLEQGRLDEAEGACRRAIALAPDLAEAHNNLGNALKDLGRLDEAANAYRRAIQHSPEHAAAHSNLGNVLWEQHRLGEAVAACRRAIALAPGLAAAHNNLGNALRDQGELTEAIASFRTAVALLPNFVQAASNLVCSLHYHPEHDAQSILQAHRRWARQYAAPLAPEIRPHPNDRTPDRKLRIGYVSPDFRNHPVGHLLLPLFSHHDHGQFEILGYSDVPTPDRTTEQLQTLADCWRETVGLSDRRLADLIRADRIDILVDLALHTARNRLLVFARKPAPVQVTMLGMPATTGLATMDYRLTDPYLDPPGQGDADYTEQSIRLPHCYWCYQPPVEAPPAGPLPASENGFVTFGCLNQFAKMSRPALQLWAKVLQAVPAARLVLLSHPGRHLDAARRVFQESNIADNRVEFTARAGRSTYFERYTQLDLSLDPFPYNGHTTTLDSLWMGVPVITLEGRTAVGRGGVSILSNLGLPELIARTPEEYVAIAVEGARDRARLAALRAGLREKMKAAPLMDEKGYARDVEAAFRGMWKRWCGV